MNVRANAFSTVRFKTNTYSVPVKQNVTPEVLEEPRALKRYDNVINILEHFDTKTSETNPAISDSVIIKPVDFHQYDTLGIGKEVRRI